MQNNEPIGLSASVYGSHENAKVKTGKAFFNLNISLGQTEAGGFFSKREQMTNPLGSTKGQKKGI